MHTVTEIISPAKAQEYLDTSAGNRILRVKWVNDLSRMMVRGEFYHSHQGIAFDDQGHLRDGHHRLRAVVNSGVSVTMQVTRGNLTIGAIRSMDGGAKRTTSDGMQFTGCEWATPRHAAAGRVLFQLLHKRTPDAMEAASLIEEWRHHIDAALDEIGKNTAKHHACVVAMLALAFSNGHKEALEGWAKCFTNGIGTEQWHTSATTMYAWWATNNTGGGSTARQELCRRLYGSMRAWIERRPLAKCYPSSKIEWVCGASGE